MTIAQADQVDGIGIDSHSHELVLIISDHLTWENEAAHVAALETKIGAYLGFLNDRQHLQSVPSATGLPIRIKVLHQYEPTSVGQMILQTVENQLATRNIRFSYGPLPVGY